MTIITIVSLISKRKNENIKKLITIYIYSLSMLIVMYPISDEIHMLIGGLITIIGLIYMINLLLKKIYKKININKKYKIYKIITLFIWIIISAIILITSINKLYDYIISDKNDDIEHYKYIRISENLKNRIKEIDNFIMEKENEGKKVYILDAEASIYMIPLDKYNKDYDMFLKGNIGKDGESGQIEKIKQKDENSLYLIRKRNMTLNWQTPKEVINYIRENLEKIGEIEIYEIYR